MPNEIHPGVIIKRLREERGLSQAEVAKQLPFTATASRLSRVESGDLDLSDEEAQQLARAIGSESAEAFAEYLGWEWKVLPAPGFDHASREALWEAEQALQRLTELKDDPELKNAFVKQVESCRLALERSAKFLFSTEHPVAFIGKPNVGKTTAICALTGLWDDSEKDLNRRQMGLQTGGGRTTTCEVHIRYGGEYSILVEPFSDGELRQYVAEFCDQLLASTTEETSDESRDGVGNAAEAERALRNMTDLKAKRIKEADGTFRVEDRGKEFAQAHPDRADLQIQVMAKLNLAQRRRTSVSYPRGSAISEIKWLSKTFAQINFGLHPEFPLPRRIEISVPDPILNAKSLGIRLIDTRGIDEPSAPRRDLQSFLDDERAVLILCSGFGDAPDAAVQAVIERAGEAGLHKALIDRGTLLVIPKGGEETTVLDNESGEPVEDPDEAREIRRDQIRTTQFTDLGVRRLSIEFLDARNREDDCQRIQRCLVERVVALRRRVESQVSALTATVDELIANKADADVKKVFEQATNPLRTWLKNNRAIIVERKQEFHAALLTSIRDLRYAASLRAAANLIRRGSWLRFDYWFGLGLGARNVTVARATNQIIVLKGHVETGLQDEKLSDAHGFLKHFLTQVEETTASFFVEVQQLGEAAFADQLREDRAYWEKCQQRWGGGPGYKDAIREWTRDWFKSDARKARHDFVEKEIQRRWQTVIDRLAEHLEPAGAIKAAVPA